MIRYYTRLIISALLLSPLFLLQSCSGGGGSSNPPSAPDIPSNMQVSTQCTSMTQCSATFSWNQSDFAINKNYVTHLLIYKTEPHTLITAQSIVDTNVPNTSAPINDLLSGLSYELIYNTSDHSGTSPNGSLTFTPRFGNHPDSPSNITVKTSCPTTGSCNAYLTWSQANYQTGDVTHVTIKTSTSNPTTVFQSAINDQGQNNNTLQAPGVLTANTAYVADLYTYPQSDPSNTSHTVQSGIFTPTRLNLRGSGMYIYDEGFDLTNNTTPLSSAWASHFSTTNLTYLYPDVLYVSSVPEGYSNFNSYFSQTVLTLCHTSLPEVGLGYLGHSNKHSGDLTGICQTGTAITKAYKHWSLLNNKTPIVMPVLEFNADIKTQLKNASNTDIDFLAKAIATIVNNDPNADGVSVDYEYAPTPTLAPKLFLFFTSLRDDLKTLAGNKPAKLLAEYGNKSVFTGITKNGVTLWQVLNTNNCNDRCFAILPLYDIGVSDTGQLGSLTSYTNAVASGNSPSPESTVQTAVLNHTPFQFAIPASASNNNWGTINVYGSVASSKVPTTPSTLIKAGSCTTQHSGNTSNTLTCTSSYTQLYNGESTPVTPTDYTCTVLSEINIMLYGQNNTENLGCMPRAPIESNPAVFGKIPNMDHYFIGLALYRLGSQVASVANCLKKQQTSSTHCLVAKVDNLMQVPSTGLSSLTLNNQFMSESW